MNDDAGLLLLGPSVAEHPLVLDSPHSGHRFPADFDAAVSARDLRDGEDCHIERLYGPAAERGVPLLAALFPRTYIDVNRHETDIDLALIDGEWPGPIEDSGKAQIGKALIWRLLDDGRAIYGRRLSVAEVQRRITRHHRPYHAALRKLIDGAHARFGQVLHLNLHSMRAVAGVMGVGGPGHVRPDFVLGDRDGSSCDPRITTLVRDQLTAMGYRVQVNDPFKGVELVRAHSDPASGRHSLQIEVNRALYMDESTLVPTPGFNRLQEHLMTLIDQLKLSQSFGQGARA